MDTVDEHPPPHKHGAFTELLFWQRVPLLNERLQILFWMRPFHWSEITTCELLPVPFRAGDIITVDCRPFIPVSHAVILEIGDNCDCCCLQALFCTGDGAWKIGAVKHGDVSPNHYISMLSPLYRLSFFHGQLPEEEQLLEKVSQYLSGDESRGIAMWGYIVDLWCENDEHRVTDEQILSYIENGGEI